MGGNLKMTLCNRKNLCVDCDDKECIRAGVAESDCIKHHCDNAIPLDCNHCDFMRRYQKEVREQHIRERKRKKRIENYKKIRQLKRRIVVMHELSKVDRAIKKDVAEVERRRKIAALRQKLKKFQKCKKG